MGFNPGGGGGSSSVAGSTDVALSSPQNNQMLGYESSSAKWQNKNVPTGSGGINDPEVYQMPAPSGGDDTSAINAALSGLDYNKTRVVLFRSGIYLTTGIVIPHPMSVVFRGVGIGHVGDVRGTRIRRIDSGSGPVIYARGDTSTLTNANLSKPEYRVRFDIHDMEIHGNSAGVGLNCFRGSENIFENVRFARCPLGGLIMNQHFNARVEGCFVGYSGTGTTYPAMVITGTAEGTASGTNTVHLTDCELENNNGTDILVTKASGGGSSVAVMIGQLKTERGSGDYPQIEVTSGGELQMINSYLYLGSGTSTPQIRVSGGRFIGSALNIKRGGSGSDYAIYQTGAGSLVNISGSYFESFPADKSIRVGSDVAPHRLRLVGISMIPSEEQADRLIRDDRSSKGTYNYPV